MIAKIKRAEQFADLIEVRLDYLSMTEGHLLDPKSPVWDQIGRLMNSSTKPIVSTFRPKDQGGHHELSQAGREMFWNSGYETEICDVEEDMVETSRSSLWPSRICSYHDFSGMPEDVPLIFERLAAAGAEEIGGGPETVKIAALANDITDAIPIWRLLAQAKSAGQQIIPIAMGEAGKWTRILGLAHGAFLTYGSLDCGDETAPGQIPATDLVETYRVKDLDRNTEVYGVIGDPVSGSLSPYMHNAGFVSAGRNAVFIPLAVADLDAFMRRMVMPATREVELNFRGFAVTMPHKQAIMKYLDEIDPTAAAIGAINTVAIRDGRMTGYNTDDDGFIEPLIQNYGELAGAHAAVFGTGGAARACVYALKRAGAEVTINARDGQTAAALTKEFELRPTRSISKLSDEIDIIVNATPLGMKGEFENESILGSNTDLANVKLVYDLVTNGDTPLMAAAGAAGIRVLGGLEMLTAQGELQFEIWTGCKAPKGLMKRAALARMKRQ